ncbi:dynamin family protein [Planococcus sp. X10-3]|uniref:dynamin family protein n=1 Tax=Planococcus sp. X10-3 TaxID=3061240 RepID=UPI003BAF9609
MGIELNEYQENRSLLIDEINRYKRALQEMVLEDELQKVNQYESDILNDNFQLAVVGEFSRGKSTFINALLGQQILPSSAKPTTTILNKIVYSPYPFIKLYYHNGMKAPDMITEEEFKKLVAPMDPIAGDEASEKEYEEIVDYMKKIKYAEIGRNLPLCANGVEVIDTPGTNDLDPIREEITNTIIPRSDAAILLLSALKILSESEMSLLRDRLLANDIQKVFIVVNFKDQLGSKEEERKVLEFAYEHLKEILDQPKIFMVSAKHALNARRKQKGEEMATKRRRPVEVWNFEDTGFPELEMSLADFLQYERGSIKLLKPLKRTVGSIKEVKKNQIDFERNALNSRTKGLKEKVATFRPKVKVASENGKKARKELVKNLKFEEKELLQWYGWELEKITNKALSTFEENRRSDLAEISQKVDAAVGSMERNIFEAKKERMKATAKRVITSASKEMNAELASMELEVTNMTAPQSVGSLVPSLYRNHQPDYVIDDYFDSIHDSLEETWHNPSGFWMKAGAGVGIVGNAVAYGITKSISWTWSKFKRNDEKAKFKIELQNHYDNSNKNKMKIIEAEYKAMSNSVEGQFKDIVEKQLKQVDGQLKQLVKSTELEGKEIDRRLSVLVLQEQELDSIQTNLQQLARKVQQQAAGKVGAF